MIKKVLDQSIFATSEVTEANSKLFQFLEHKTPADYDKIMDMVYRETHIGGGFHRHFDSSHTLAGSFEKIKEATGDVDFTKYLKAHINELVTPNGIPLFNLERGAFRTLTDELSESLGGHITPGQLRSYLHDLNSVNAGELLAATLGGAFMLMAFRSGSAKSISRVTAINLCLGFATANPLQIFTGLSGLSLGLYQGKIKSYDLLAGAAPVIAGLSAGALASAAGATTTSTLFIGIITSIGTAALINHLELADKDVVTEELGDNQNYLSVMTPAFIKEEIELASRNQLSLAVQI
jgi:hypothetical protein